MWAFYCAADIFVVATLELHKFYSLNSMNFISSYKERSLCVLGFDTKILCIGINMPKLHVVILGGSSAFKFLFVCLFFNLLLFIYLFFTYLRLRRLHDVD